MEKPARRWRPWLIGAPVAAAAIVLIVVLSVVLTQKQQSGAAPGLSAPAGKQQTLMDGKFYVGVNLGMLSLFPFSKSPYNHTTEELKQMMSVRIAVVGSRGGRQRPRSEIGQHQWCSKTHLLIAGSRCATTTLAALPPGVQRQRHAGCPAHFGYWAM